MKYSELEQMSTIELQKMLVEEKVQMVKMKFGHAIGNLENPSKLTSSRKHIARLHTEIKKRELNKAKA